MYFLAKKGEKRGINYQNILLNSTIQISNELRKTGHFHKTNLL